MFCIYYTTAKNSSKCSLQNYLGHILCLCTDENYDTFYDLPNTDTVGHHRAGYAFFSRFSSVHHITTNTSIEASPITSSTRAGSAQTNQTSLSHSLFFRVKRELY